MKLRENLQQAFNTIIFSPEDPNDEETGLITKALLLIGQASDEEKRAIAKEIGSLAGKVEPAAQLVKEQIRMLLLSLAAKEKNPSPNLQKYCLRAIEKIVDTGAKGRGLFVDEKAKLFLLDLISDQNQPLQMKALVVMANIVLEDARNEKKFFSDRQIESTMLAVSSSDDKQIQKNAVLVMRAIGSDQIPRVWAKKFATLDRISTATDNNEIVMINNQIKDDLLSLVVFEDLEVVEKTSSAIAFLTKLDSNQTNLKENNGNPSNLHLFASDSLTQTIMLDLFEKTNEPIFLSVIANVSSPLVKNTARWKAIGQQTKQELLELETVKTDLLLNLLADQKNAGLQEISGATLYALKAVANITSQDEGCELFIADERTKPVFLGLLKQLNSVSDDEVRRSVIATLTNINFLSPLDKQDKALLDKETLVTRGGNGDTRFVGGKTPIERGDISKARHFYRSLSVVVQSPESSAQNQDEKQPPEADLPPIEDEKNTATLPPPPPSSDHVKVTDATKVENLKGKGPNCCVVS